MKQFLYDSTAYVEQHKAIFALAFAWFVREWTTVNGWNGAILWFKTGKVTNQKEETVSETKKTELPPSTVTDDKKDAFVVAGTK